MRLVVCLACLAGAALPAPALAEPAAELSAALEYQQGDYGTDDRVETLTLRTQLRIDAGAAFFYGALPWHRLEAPGNVVGTGAGLLGIILDPTRPSERQRREGLGDLRLGAGYRLPPLAGFETALTGEIKLPTAADGLGTGEADLALGAELSRPIGPVTPFLALTYVMPGDPEGYELRDALVARGGLSAQLGPGIRASLAYGHARSLSPLVGDERQLSSALELGLSRRLSLGLQGSAGLSDGAADLGAALRLGWRL